MWMSHEGMGWWFVFGGFWMVAFWGTVFALLYWFLRRPSDGREDRRPLEEEPLGIAKRRLASGEITREEYDELLRVLG